MSSTKSTQSVTNGTLTTILEIFRTTFSYFYKMFDMDRSLASASSSLDAVQKSQTKSKPGKKASKLFKNALTAIICADCQLSQKLSILSLQENLAGELLCNKINISGPKIFFASHKTTLSEGDYLLSLIRYQQTYVGHSAILRWKNADRKYAMQQLKYLLVRSKVSNTPQNSPSQLIVLQEYVNKNDDDCEINIAPNKSHCYWRNDILTWKLD